MIIAGLTGSIAMGKSTVGRMLGTLGCPVFDADLAVRDFYRGAGAAAVEAAFPGVTEDGVVDRERLAGRVLGDADAMRRLERIVHPAVAQSRQRFLEVARGFGRRAVFLDVPLLFETGGDRTVDVIVVVSAKAELQRARALARAGMTAFKFEAILSRQVPDREKRRRAHFVVDTNDSLDSSLRQATGLVRSIVGLPGRRISNARDNS